MANRRMFSSRVTESTRFIKMPASSQNLYFHLGMNADDDGVVEAYPVMCTIGATEDDLRVLVGKQFATVLNEDCVTFLNDWTENNNIRADRKVDSIYKDLLLQIVPDACLKDAKPTYYSRKKDVCQTNDRQNADNCQHRLGKDRLGKDSIGYINTICSEPENPTLNQSGILLPLNDKSLYEVPQENIDTWVTAYPAVDVIHELQKMRAWLESNPTRRKTKRGIKRFINSWLSKEQDRGFRRQQYSDRGTDTRQQGTKNSFNNFKQNDYDMDDLEKNLLSN